MGSGEDRIEYLEQRLAALEQSERAYRCSFEQSPVCLARVALDGTILEVNPALCELLDYPRDEIVGRRTHEFTHPDDLEATNARLEAAQEPGARFATTKRYLRRDGESIWASLHGTTVVGADGRSAHIEVAIIDITHAMRMRTALEENERRLAAFYDAALEGMGVAERGRVVDVNPRFCAILGYSRDELVGMLVEDLVHPDDREMVRQKMMSDFAGTYEHRAIHRDGSTLHLQAHGMTGEYEGRPVRFSSIRDVTAHRRLEEQLLQTQKMEALGTMAGGVAHDMNNILAAIMMSASLLEHDPSIGANARENVDRIMAASERGRSLVQNLLGFARKGDYSKSRHVVADVVRSAVAVLEPVLPKEVTVGIEVEDPKVAIFCDEAQISQMLLNLCINASDAIEIAGTISISVASSELGKGNSLGLPAGGYATIQVIDDGCGMDPKTRQQALEPFFTTKGVGEGTGLGLPMAYGVTRNHGGALELDSTKGVGTTVTLWFPGVRQDETRQENEADQSATAPKGSTILIVDDEEMVRVTLQRALETTGHAALPAASAAEAVELYRGHRDEIDLVLLDVSMPTAGGRTCMDMLRDIDARVRIVICTGHGEHAHIASMLAGGALGVLRKPFTMAELSEAVERGLSA